jgi:hypothetical protein
MPPSTLAIIVNPSGTRIWTLTEHWSRHLVVDSSASNADRTSSKIYWRSNWYLHHNWPRSLVCIYARQSLDNLYVLSVSVYNGIVCWTTDSVYVLDIVVAVSVQFFDCRHSIFAYGVHRNVFYLIRCEVTYENISDIFHYVVYISYLRPFD